MAINELGGFRGMDAVPKRALSAAQEDSLRRIRLAHALAAPAGLLPKPQAALRQLLKEGASYSAVPGRLAVYDRELVSLSRGQQDPVERSAVLGGKALEQYLHWERDMKVGHKELARAQEDTSSLRAG